MKSWNLKPETQFKSQTGRVEGSCSNFVVLGLGASWTFGASLIKYSHLISFFYTCTALFLYNKSHSAFSDSKICHSLIICHQKCRNRILSLRAVLSLYSKSLFLYSFASEYHQGDFQLFAFPQTLHRLVSEAEIRAPRRPECRGQLIWSSGSHFLHHSDCLPSL